MHTTIVDEKLSKKLLLPNNHPLRPPLLILRRALLLILKNQKLKWISTPGGGVDVLRIVTSRILRIRVSLLLLVDASPRTQKVLTPMYLTLRLMISSLSLCVEIFHPDVVRQTQATANRINVTDKIGATVIQLQRAYFPKPTQFCNHGGSVARGGCRSTCWKGEVSTKCNKQKQQQVRVCGIDSGKQAHLHQL